MDGRVKLEISLGCLAENFREIRRRAQKCRVMAVLKANAYGLGVRRIAETVKSAGASAVGVAEMAEAAELSGLGLPIQILGNLLPGEVPAAVEQGIICPVNSLEMAQIISAEAQKQNKTVCGAVTLDSGMGRVGFLPENAVEEVVASSKLPNLKLTGIYSHFSSAFIKSDPYSAWQMERFKAVLAGLERHGIMFRDIHMAASDAINNFPESSAAPFNLVRAGINMYGFYDNGICRSMQLKPIVEMKALLAAVRTLPAGSAIGYGRMHKLRKTARVGTVAAGYADGLPLALSNRGYILINNVLCPVLGRISMDYTAVSLENAPDAKWGDEAVCFGHQGAEEISVDDWAQLKGTHAYDILCSIGTRVQRVYLE